SRCLLGGDVDLVLRIRSDGWRVLRLSGRGTARLACIASRLMFHGHEPHGLHRGVKAGLIVSIGGRRLLMPLCRIAIARRYSMRFAEFSGAFGAIIFSSLRASIALVRERFVIDLLVGGLRIELPVTLDDEGGEPVRDFRGHPTG